MFSIDTFFYALILIVFIYSVVKFFSLSRRYTKHLGEIRSTFEEIKRSPTKSVESLNPSTQTVAYQQCLIGNSKKGPVVATKHERILVNMSVNEFVPYSNLSDLKSVPAILTTAGILGTFTGISIGLYSLGSGWEEVSQLANQAKELLAGMKTAFFTSIAGMGASGVVMVCFSVQQARLNSKRSEVVSDLEAYVQVASPNELLYGLLDHAKSTASSQTDLTELIEAIKAQADRPDPITISELQSVVQPLHSLTEAKLTSLEKTIKSGLSSYEAANIRALSHLPEQLSTRLSESITQPISQDLSQVNSALSTVVDLIGEQQSDSQQDSKFPSFEDIRWLFKQAVEPLVDQSKSTNQTLEAISAKATKTNSQLEAVSETAEEANHSISVLVGSVSSIQAETSKLVEPIEKSTEVINRVLNTETQTLDTLKKISSDTAFGLSDIKVGISELAQSRTREFSILVDAMGEQIVKPITAELGQTNKVVHEFAQVSDKLNNSVAKTVAEMAKATSTIENFEQETLAKLNDFAGSMDKSLNEFAINSTKALNSITSEVQGIVKLGNESIKEQTQAFSSMVSDSETIFKDQAATLSNVGKESALLMSSAKNELVTGLGDIDNKVKDMSRTVQGELKTFRDEYQQNLTAYFEQQNNALEKSLESQKDGLNEVITNFAGVFKEEYEKRSQLINDLNTQYSQLVDSADRIQTMAKAIGLDRATSLSELQLIEQSLGRQIGALNHSFTSAAQDFNEVASRMKPEMDDYFARANKGVAEYFASFDEVSKRIYTRLDRAAEMLILAKEEADEATKRVENAELDSEVS